MKDIISHMVNVANVDVNVLRLVCKEWKTATEQRFADLQSGKISCGHKKCMRKQMLLFKPVEFQQFIKKDAIDRIFILNHRIDTDDIFRYSKIGGNLYNFAIMHCRKLKDYTVAINRCINGGFFKELDQLFEIWGDRLMDCIEVVSDLTIEYLYSRKYISKGVREFTGMSKCRILYGKLSIIIYKYKYFDRLIDLNHSYLENIGYIFHTPEIFYVSNINDIIKRLGINTTAQLMAESKPTNIEKYINVCKDKWNLLILLIKYNIFPDISTFAKSKSIAELQYILKIGKALNPEQMLKLINDRFANIE